MNQILVQNIETFATIPTLDNMDAFDAWLETSDFGIVSLDADADGEYSFVALVAPQDGPDFIMDEATGEMEPVEDIDPAAELAAKMDIMLEIDEEESLEIAPVAFTAPTTKPRKPRKTKTQPNTGAKMRNFEILASFITKYPGVSRTDVFCHQDLLQPLRTKAQRRAIAGGDKLEIKRWNRRLNFLIREMRRQGVDIQIERKGRIAHYTIGQPDGQLELPFTPAAEARNATIIGDVSNEVLEGATPIEFSRANEDENQMLDFDTLLATLDEEAVAPVTK